MAFLPKQGCLYTLRNIETLLALTDIPHLMFNFNGHRCVVQNSHLSKEQLLSVPGFADTAWRYLYTTREEIPIFSYESCASITNFVDIVEDTCNCSFCRGELWVTPKGFPREYTGCPLG